ncbi:MAG: hypothetical protein BWX86_02049 [Verrucomicrobia bacterium ADurb.Bin122]|nr:MAG: hypothetical protein BWX86_02049 [Verrucomicrobia bacterium ADurb.Bin122]
MGIALRRQGVVVLRRGELDGLEAGLGARATDDDGQMVRRASRRAEVLHLFGDEGFEALRIEERFRLLIEEGLVGRATALGDEEELVLGALRSVEVDLRREIGAGVNLLVHVEGGRLRVAEVFLGVALVDALGDILGVVGAGPDLLALLGDDGRGAGVLAERQDALRGNFGVLQQREGHIAVVGAGLGVVEDRRDLFQVLRAQQKAALAHRRLREEGDRLGRDLENLTPLEGRGAHALLGDQTVLGVIRTVRIDVLVEERGSSHIVPA